MPEEKKSKVTEEVKEARKLSVEELEQVSGGAIAYKPGMELPVGDLGSVSE